MAGRIVFASVLACTAALGLAQDREAPKPAPAASGGEGSAGTVAKAPRRQWVAGTLVAFDVEKATITFTDDAGKTLTWPVEARLADHARAYAETRLQTLKEGDRVLVIHVVEAGGPRVYDVRPAVAGRRGAGRERGEGQAPPATTPAPPAPPR